MQSKILTRTSEDAVRLGGKTGHFTPDSPPQTPSIGVKSPNFARKASKPDTPPPAERGPATGDRPAGREASDPMYR